MLRPANTVSEKMIKVDHAGENGAVNIYRAQAIGCRLFARDLLMQILDNQAHEERHRSIFATQLERWGVKRCISYHLCGIGGYALGLVTGLLGRQAIYATTFAVEHVVLEHLEHQLEYLGSVDADAHECVATIVADEQEHHDKAQTGLHKDGLLNRVIITIVQLSTEGVIRFGMR